MPNEVNQIVSFVFDDELDMAKSVGYKEGDLYKIALSKATNSLYVLMDTTAGTWRKLSSAKPELTPLMHVALYGNSSAQAPTATNFCYHHTIVISSRARRFRFPIKNANLTSPFRVQSAAIATTNTIGADPTIGTTTGQPRFTPQGGTGWTPVTWSGATSVEVAPAPGTGRYTKVWSDWINCPTTENADGSGKCIVHIRLWVLGTTSSPGNSYTVGTYTQAWRSLASNSALHGGFIWECLRSTVDGVATPANFQPNVQLSGSPLLTELQYESYTPGLNIIGLAGDSWMAGAVNGSGGNFGNGWLFQLVNELRAENPNIPIELTNIAIAGGSSNTYLQNAKDFVATTTNIIGIPIIMTGSVNDGIPSDALVEVQRNRTMELLAISKAFEFPPVLFTCQTNTSVALTAPQDAIRLAYRAEWLSAKDYGLKVIDGDSVLDGASPNRMVSAWTIDNAHPSELGYSVLASAGKTVITL